MKKTFKKYFIPHEDNNHKPHFLREKSVAFLAAVIVSLFMASVLGTYLVGSSRFLASIQSAFLVDLANNDRSINGASKLIVNEKLTLAAQLKANDMAEKGYFAHTSPEGVTPWHWFAEAGYQYVYAGENLAVNFSRSEDVQRAWMDSPTHRANILNNRYKEVGIATAEGEYKGRRTTFVVQMFGTPSAGMLSAITTQSAPASVPVQQVESEIEPVVAGDFDVSPEPVSVVITPNESNALNIEPSKLADSEERQIEDFLENNIIQTNQLDNTINQNQNIAGEEDSNETEILPYTNRFQRILINPSIVVSNAYTILFALILFSLILKIFISIKKQHPKNIFFGVILLILVLVFMYLNQEIFSDPIVASVFENVGK